MKEDAQTPDLSAPGAADGERENRRKFLKRTTASLGAASLFLATPQVAMASGSGTATITCVSNATIPD